MPTASANDRNDLPRPARIDPRDKLAYRYGVWSARFPTVFARAALGGQSLGFPLRLFRMRLGWPGQDWSLLGLVLGFILFAALAVPLCRREAALRASTGR